MNRRRIVGIFALLLLCLISCGTGAEDPDSTVLTNLEEAGSDLSKPHDLEFFLYFPDESAAEAAAEDMRARGYEVQVRPSEDGTDWLCFAEKTMVPDYEAIRDISRDFEAIAAAHGGEYDGWGTTVVP